MKATLVVFVIAVSLVACLFQTSHANECQRDEDCPRGHVCYEYGACKAPNFRPSDERPAHLPVFRRQQWTPV
ncbi:hypothetical protein AAVH_08592 [Aphelenchoides avenae]|nr:hypothetical protein AAVH_08592 [Aphelenchus avenae]